LTPSSTVIVVSYRPGGWLMECLESVSAQADEVVLVDNGSAGEEASRIGSSVGARVVRSPVNVGFAGGVGLGLANARGELVGLLNDDAVASPNWLDAAAAALADPTVAAVTPKVVLAGWYREIVIAKQRLLSVEVDGGQVRDLLVGAGIATVRGGGSREISDREKWATGLRPFYVPVAGPDQDPAILINGEAVPAGPAVRIVNHAGSYLRTYGAAGEYGRGAPDDGRFDAQEERFGFSGTAPVFRAETLHRIGGFAPEFFAYNEDTDWCMRARLVGLRIMYDPKATVIHRLSATSGGPDSTLVRFLHERNALLCLLRNAPARVAGRHFLARLARHPWDRVSRAVASMMPWAFSSRWTARKTWVGSPREVWNAWAERDLHWDDGPVRQ
jgi:N-acetylglucosaminyl-diphospho-decaprenol L-rhamnosyltransferase